MTDSNVPSTQTDFQLDVVQIFGGAIWFGLSMAMGLLLEFGTQGLVAARLGPSDFGIYSVGVQIFEFCRTLALLALPSALTYFVPRYRSSGRVESIRSIIGTSFWLSLTGSLLVGFILYILAEPIANQVFNSVPLVNVLRLLALAIPTSAILALVAGSLRGLKLSRQASMLTSTYDRALRLGFVSLFMFMGLGLTAPALAYLPATLLALLLGLYYLHKSDVGLVLAKPAASIVSKMMRYSGPLLLSQLVMEVRGATYPLALAYFLDTRAIGIFAVARLLGNSLHMVLVAFNFLYSPIISSLSPKTDVLRIQLIYRSVATWAFTIICPIWLFMVLFAGSFLNLFGSQYSEGIWALRLLATTGLINVGMGSAGTTLLATGETRRYLQINIIGIIASGVLSLLLIPQLGLIGAAMAQVLTNAIWNGLTLFTIHRLNGIQPFNRHYIYVFITSLMCLILLYPLFQLVLDMSHWTVLGLLPVYAGSTLFILIRFQLLDEDSQTIVNKLLVILRTRFASVPA